MRNRRAFYDTAYKRLKNCLIYIRTLLPGHLRFMEAASTGIRTLRGFTSVLSNKQPIREIECIYQSRDTVVYSLIGTDGNPGRNRCRFQAQQC